MDNNAKDIVLSYAQNFLKNFGKLKYVQAAISEARAQSCVRVVGEQRAGLSGSAAITQLLTQSPFKRSYDSTLICPMTLSFGDSS